MYIPSGDVFGMQNAEFWPLSRVTVVAHNSDPQKGRQRCLWIWVYLKRAMPLFGVLSVFPVRLTERACRCTIATGRVRCLNRQHGPILCARLCSTQSLALVALKELGPFSAPIVPSPMGGRAKAMTLEGVVGVAGPPLPALDPPSPPSPRGGVSALHRTAQISKGTAPLVPPTAQPSPLFCRSFHIAATHAAGG